MPRTGRPTTPTEVKRRRGTLRKDRMAREPLTVLPSVVTQPRMVEQVDGAGLVQRLLDAGASAWVGTTDQLGVLTLLAEAWDERQTLRAALYDRPPDDLDPKVALLWATSARKDLRDLEKQITQWLSLLGLTPSDRSRLGVAEVKARTKLEELADRRAARTGLRVG